MKKQSNVQLTSRLLPCGPAYFLNSNIVQPKHINAARI